jgi:hypothetical protein
MVVPNLVRLGRRTSVQLQLYNGEVPNCDSDGRCTSVRGRPGFGEGCVIKLDKLVS